MRHRFKPKHDTRRRPHAGFARLASSLVFDARGTTAIEFAIVFPLFFMVFYGIITFSLIFVAEQTLTLAAEEGARAALRYQPNATTVAQALNLRSAAACVTANGAKNWLASASACATTYAPCTYDTTLQCVNVALSYDYTSHPLVPSLPLLSVALPSTLTARAMVQLNPDNVL